MATRRAVAVLSNPPPPPVEGVVTLTLALENQKLRQRCVWWVGHCVKLHDCQETNTKERDGPCRPSQTR